MFTSPLLFLSSRHSFSQIVIFLKIMLGDKGVQPYVLRAFIWFHFFTFNSLIHLEFILVFGVSSGPRLFFYMIIWLSRQHLLKNASFVTDSSSANVKYLVMYKVLRIVLLVFRELTLQWAVCTNGAFDFPDVKNVFQGKGSLSWVLEVEWVFQGNAGGWNLQALAATCKSIKAWEILVLRCSCRSSNKARTEDSGQRDGPKSIIMGQVDYVRSLTFHLESDRELQRREWKVA